MFLFTGGKMKPDETVNKPRPEGEDEEDCPCTPPLTAMEIRFVRQLYEFFGKVITGILATKPSK